MKNKNPRVVFGINIRAFVSTLCSFAILMMPFAQMAAATRAASTRTIERSNNRTARARGRSNAAPIAGSPSISATLTDNRPSVDPAIASPGDTINYKVVISNTGSGDATGVQFNQDVDANTAVVGGSVKMSPVVTTQPTDQTVCAGGTATFTSAANGTPAPTVQWQVDSGSGFGDISGATSTTLSFSTVAGDNGKLYRAVFTNSLGATTTNAVTLRVDTLPVVSTNPLTQTSCAGGPATFTAAASSNAGQNLQWQVDSGSGFSDIPGATSTTLSFTSAAGDNGKQYRAVFTNSCGSVNTTSATLVVDTLPVVTTDPLSQTVCAGGTATFTAAATSNASDHTVQWQVDAGSGFNDIPGATSTTLSFSSVAGDNGKKYRAVFTDACGSTNTAAATLTVDTLPVVTTDPTNTAVCDGATANFSAAATSNASDHTVQWQVDSGSGFNNIPGATSTTLSFSAVAADNGKKYRAVFTDACGPTNTAFATLTVNTAPSVTTNPGDQGTQQGSSVSFTAAANGSPAPTVQWQVDSGSGFNDIPGATNTTYTHTAQLSENGYKYRAVFTNSCGTATTTAATLTVTCQTITVNNPANNTGTAGSSFSETFTQTDAFGTATFTTGSTLPTGLTLSTGGVLSGTPTQTGSFPITVTVTDSNNCPGTGSVYSLTINCQTITVNNPATNSGTVGSPFSQIFTQTDAIGSVTFTTASTLPNGLTLATDGTLSGTPTELGTFPIVVTVTDGNNCPGTGAPYNLTINCQTITVTNPTNTSGTVNSSFSEQFNQTDGIGGGSFSTASTLPTGITLSSAGLLAGTTTQSGPFNIVVTFTDGNGCTGTGPTYNLTISCPTITPARTGGGSFPDGTAGTAYTGESFTASGGTAPYTFAVTGGTFPTGLSLDTGGTISGTPTTDGSFTFTVTATDAYGCTGNAGFSIKINPAVDESTTLASINQHTQLLRNHLSAATGSASGTKANHAWTTTRNRHSEVALSAVPPACSTTSTHVCVDVGTIPAGQSVTITFSVTINAPYSGGANVSTQGTVSGGNFANVSTDDPDTGTANDATLTPVCSSSITVANLNDSGAGSLRQAILDLCPAGGTISFDPALTSSAAVTITLTSGELVLDKNITINGATNHGLTISGNNASRVLNIQSGKSVTLSTITISSGLATQGGGILNAGTLIITNSTISNNHTTNGANSSGPGVNGGSSGGGGGIYNANTGTLKLFNSTISGNQPGRGGDASGTDSAGNGGNGGGILNAGGSVTSVNTTITNNKTGPNGDNTTTDTPGPFGTPGVGGGIYSSGGTVILRNTIVAGNFSVFQQLGPPRTFANSDDDINGAVDPSSANNLVGVDTGMTGITNGNQGNKIGTAATPFSALLNVLADNGGPTFTHEPQTGSPAIDAGDNTLAKDQNNNDLTTDQRGAGFDRIINSTVDMGSVESNPNLGSGSVVDLGVTKLADADQVVAGSNVTYTITVTSGGPDVVSATLTDNLPGSMQFVSLNAPVGWGCTTPAVGSGGQVKCTRSLAPTSGQVFTLVGKIPNGTVPGTVFNNFAVVSTTAVDPDDENNSGTASTTVTPPYADLILTKTGPSQVHSNSDVTYTITVTNPSSNAATNVHFSDTLPSSVPGGVAMTFVSFTPNSGPVWNCGSPAATTSCSIANLPGNTTSVFSFVGHVPNGLSDGVQYTNQTTVFSDVDPNSENDTGNIVTTIASCFSGQIVTSNADSGSGTLRQAIIDACDGAAISFDMTQVVSPITLTSAELLINKSLTIGGPGADLLTVQRSQAGGTPNFRIFNISVGTVSISGLSISNGSATGDGSGVRSLGTLTLTNCSLSNNQTTTAAGGLYVENADATVSGCTFTGNTAATSGSAVGYRGFTGTSTHTLSLTNSTFSGNTTVSGLGAVFAGPGTTQLTNCTIANNTGTGIDVQAFLAGSTATVVVGNTIVANNSAASVSTSSGGGGTTVFTSQGNNLTSDNSAFFNQASDIKNTDPLLGVLANNGGPTQTRALLTGSSAIDAGNNALVTNPPFSGPPFTDQRGSSFGRIVDGPDVNTTATVDIGAFEAQVSVEDVSDKATNEDTQLQFTFNVGGVASITSVTATSSNTTLVPNNAANIALSGSGSTRTLTINPVANLFGTSTITVTVNGNSSQSMTDTFVLTVNPVGDAPSVTNASTTVNTQTTSGLVITKNAVDGAEITHFKITNITNGTLFKNDGTTQINNGDFITAAEGGAGLKFTPALNSTAVGSFDVQAAPGNDGSGLSSAATATITINCGPTVVTTNADNGAGSLRDIILHACTGATITFDPALNGQTITLTTSELLINKNLAITGPGANLLTISGNNVRRIFNITTGSSVSITGLTLRSGRVASGGTNQGGAIFNAGNLTLASDTVSNSSVQSGANSGGGIFNAAGGTLTITGSTVTGNQASAGSSNQGGGIANLGTLTITNSTIDANNALNASGSGANNKGGGIYSEGTLTVTGSEISNNFARGNNSTNEGGGIYSAGNATITSSTLVGNIVLGINGSSSGFGGGVRSVSNKLTVVNSTIANNQVVGNNTNFGGGIENGSGSTLVLVSSTVASNSVGGGGGASGGGVRTIGPANVRNTIIANNSAPTSPDVDGTFNSQGHNLIQNISGSNGFGSNGDITGVDPLLTTISNYGGPTQTMPLRAGSPAFDAGDNCVTDVAHCSDPDIPQLAFDQRGTPFARSVDGPDADTTAAVDIGAFEAQVSIENIPDKTINEDGQLQFTFNIGGGANVTNVLAVSLNPTLVPNNPANIALSGSGMTRTLTINPAANLFGAALIFVNVVGANSQSLSDTFVLTVNPVADTPSVTNASTTAGSQTTSGLVVSRSPVDGAEVTHFKITNITGGTLFKNDGTTQINNDTFITFAEGNAGLKFTPPLSTANGSFQVQASLSNNNSGLGGGLATATISVTKAATTTTIASSVNPSDRNQNVTFTANVTSVVTPTGLVQFKDNGANFGAPTALNASGVAQITTGALTVGNHTITADYLGDANFQPSSASLTQTVVLRALIKFSQADYSVNENGKVITITVVRSNDTSQAVTVDFSTTDDSAAMTVLPCSNASGVASPRCDFTTALGTLRFAAGETTKTFDVLISQDLWLEGNERTQLTLSNLTGGAAFQQPSDASAELTIVDDDSSPPSTNAIDDSATFVRQHYHDFLNREPDTAGLNFWVNQIESCGADAQCRAVKRVNVSAAFFLSIEFQNTGYFVERMHKSAFGDIAPPTVPVPIRFTTFLTDSQQITNGVVVGVGNWQTQLDNNKKAFALAFVQRTAFVNRYPAITSATAFVDSLNANAGMVLSDAERSALISQLSPNPSDSALRADVLMKVAENALLQQREFNRAFVLMQYFGYLRRNPDAAPEPTLNFNGYNFWLNKLNQANGDYVGAELIKAFITSSEYRGRFGP